MDSIEVKEQAQFEGLIQGLIDNEYSWCNDFLSPIIIAGLADNIQTLSDLEKMKSAGIGNNAEYQKDKSIRGDKINWIVNQSTNSFEIQYLQKIEKFILYLNKTCFTSINYFESHYALYEKESFYARHLDQFKTDNGRKFSIVLYLNQDWMEEDGGLLALYPKKGAQINISPIGGRIVLFRSDEMEHEVNPSFTRDRRSIAGWLKN